MSPSNLTIAKSRTLFNNLLASLGVPRDLLASSYAPSLSILTESFLAELIIITDNSSDVNIFIDIDACLY